MTVEEEVATYLNNRKRRELSRIEDENQIEILILGREGLGAEHLQIECCDGGGREVRFSG